MIDGPLFQAWLSHLQHVLTMAFGCSVLLYALARIRV